MASRMRAATVSERPRTSAGQSSKFFDKPNSNKRVSRDDLTLALKGSGRGHVRAYHVPGRGRLPSPDTSPRSDSRTTMVRTATPESLDDRDTGLIAIGMALGSPSQAPEHMPAPWNASRAVAAAFDIPEPLDDAQTKPKAKKWGIFSRSKSRRGRPENRPKRSMTDISNPSNTSISSGAGSLGAGQGIKGPLDQSTRKAPKHKPIVIRSQTEPAAIHQVQHQEPKPSNELNRKVSMQSTRGRSPTLQPMEGPPSPIPPVPQLSGPFLDIEIPSVTMERYSVMFGSVLQTQAASGLLARRQANLDCLMTIKDEVSRENGEDLLRPRRATSPQPRNSPTFSLFPQTPRGVTSSFSQMPSPRLRSNTSPALLPSPSQATFEEGKVMRREPLRAKVVQVGGSKDSRRDVDAGSRPLQLVSKFNKQPSFLAQETSNLTESPENTDIGTFYIHHEDMRKPAVAERIRPTPSLSIAPASSSPQVPEKPEIPLSKTTSNSSNHTAHTEVDPDQAFRNAVEISIARQISVSRQQRNMLRPLQRQQSWKTQTNSSANSVVSDTLEDIPVGKNERLSQTKTSTPKLVNPRNLLGSPDELLVNRKSELVILEGP